MITTRNVYAAQQTKTNALRHPSTQGARLVSPWTVLLAWCVLALTAVTHAAPPSSLSVAFLFPTSLTDLGYTYQMNRGRLSAAKRFQQRYPNITLRQTVVLNVNDMANPDLCHLFTSLCATHDVVIPVSSTILPRIPNATAIMDSFLSTRVVEFNLGNLLRGVRRVNYAAMGLDVHHAMYLVGAAAGAACVAGTEFGVLAPIPLLGAFNAIHEGMKFGQQFRLDYSAAIDANRTKCRLVVVNQNTFENPTNEVEIAGMFLERNASIMFFWVDFADAIRFVDTHRPNAETFSIAYSTDGTLTLGDSVATSLVIQPTRTFLQIFDDYVQGVPTNQTFYLATVAEGGFGLGRFSAQLPREVPIAAQRALTQLNVTGSPLCGPIVNATGSVVLPAGQCLNITQIQTVSWLAEGIVMLPPYVSSVTCGEGTYASRNISTFVLRCVPCPAGTVSSSAGSLSCRLCASPFCVPNANRTRCICSGPLRSDSKSARIAIASTLGALGGLFLLVVTVYVVYSYLFGNLTWIFRRVKLRRAEPAALVAAPTGPRIAIAMLGIDAARSEPTWRKSIDFVTQVYDMLSDTVRPLCVESGVYETINVGDVYILVHQRPHVLVRCLAQIDEAFRRSVLRLCPTRQLHLRVVVHYGDATVVRLNTGSSSARVQFVGPEIVMVRNLWASRELHAFSPYVVTAQAAAELVPVTSPNPPRKGVCADILESLATFSLVVPQKHVPVVAHRLVDFDTKRCFSDELEGDTVAQDAPSTMHAASRFDNPAATAAGPEAVPTASPSTNHALTEVARRSSTTSLPTLVASASDTDEGSSSVSSRSSLNSARSETSSSQRGARSGIGRRQQLQRQHTAMVDGRSVTKMHSVLLSPNETNRLFSLSTNLLGHFMRCLGNDRRADVLIFAAVRLHLHRELGIVVPPGVTTGDQPPSSVGSSFGYSSKVKIAPRTAVRQHEQQQQQQRSDRFFALPPTTQDVADDNPMGSRSENLRINNNNDSHTQVAADDGGGEQGLSRELVRALLRSIGGQVILSMDEVELVRWLREVSDFTTMREATTGKS